MGSFDCLETVKIHPAFCEHLILGKTSAKLLKEIDRRLVTCPRAGPSLSLFSRRPPVLATYRRASRNAERTSEISCSTVNTWSKYRDISHVFKCSSTTKGGSQDPYISACSRALATISRYDQPRSRKGFRYELARQFEGQVLDGLLTIHRGSQAPARLDLFSNDPRDRSSLCTAARCCCIAAVEIIICKL